MHVYTNDSPLTLARHRYWQDVVPPDIFPEQEAPKYTVDDRASGVFGENVVAGILRANIGLLVGPCVPFLQHSVEAHCRGGLMAIS